MSNVSTAASSGAGRGRTGGAQRAVVAVLPWAIIAGLLYAGFYIELEPVGETVQPPPLEIRDQYYGIAMPAPDTLWMAGSFGKVVRSADGGRTWELQKTPTSNHLQAIAAWDERRAVAVGNAGDAIVTADGGATWTAADVPRSEVANKLINVRVGPEGRGWAVGEFGMLVHTSDYGATWSRLGEQRDVTYSDVAVLEGGRIIVSAEFGRTFLSTDAGQTWKDVQTPVQSSLTSMAFSDGMTGVAVGLEGVILVTRDGGETWNQVSRTGDPSLLREHLLAVAWAPAKRQWVAAGNKGVLVVGSETLDTWETTKVAPRDVSWHSGIAVDGERVFLTGRNGGVWQNGEWEVFFGRKG